MRAHGNPESEWLQPALSWISAGQINKSHTILLASGAVIGNYHSLTFDRQDHRFLGDFLFQAAGKESYLSTVAEAAKIYSEYLETTLSGFDAHSTSTVQAIAFSVEVPSTGS